jgi:uncharacterized protein DUF3455
MKNCNAPKNQTTRRILLIACATALAVAFTVSLPQPAHADPVTPPPVPANIEVPAGNKAFLLGHAVGTQNYICLPCPNPATSMCPDASGFAWILFTPQAALFNDHDKQLITHFFSPNPFETNTNPGVLAAGMIRATWQHSKDTSTVWGQVKPGNSSADPNFVAPGAIAWLLVTVVGAQDGPTGGDTLTPTTFIQRLNTSGGVAPSTGCSSSTNVGKQAFVPYTADYFFYEADDGN